MKNRINWFVCLIGLLILHVGAQETFTVTVVMPPAVENNLVIFVGKEPDEWTPAFTSWGGDFLDPKGQTVTVTVPKGYWYGIEAYSIPFFSDSNLKLSIGEQITNDVRYVMEGATAGCTWHETHSHLWGDEPPTTDELKKIYDFLSTDWYYWWKELRSYKITGGFNTERGMMAYLLGLPTIPQQMPKLKIEKFEHIEGVWYAVVGAYEGNTKIPLDAARLNGVINVKVGRVHHELAIPSHATYTLPRVSNEDNSLRVRIPHEDGADATNVKFVKISLHR